MFTVDDEIIDEFVEFCFAKIAERVGLGTPTSDAVVMKFVHHVLTSFDGLILEPVQTDRPGPVMVAINPRLPDYADLCAKKWTGLGSDGALLQ